MTALHISPYDFKMLKNKEMEWSSKKKKRKEKKSNNQKSWGNGPSQWKKKKKEKKEKRKKTIPNGNPTPIFTKGAVITTTYTTIVLNI